MSDSIEFYLEGALHPFLSHRGSFQPGVGDLVSARGETFLVIGRSFTIDHAGAHAQSIRCNVIVKAVNPTIEART